MLKNYNPTKKNLFEKELKKARFLINSGKQVSALKGLKNFRNQSLKNGKLKITKKGYVFDVENIIIALSEAPIEKINLIKKLYKMGNFNDVLIEAKNLLNCYPESFNLISIIGVTYSIKNDSHKALEAFQKLTYFYPFSFKGYFDLALTYDNLGQELSSIDSYKKVIALKPTYFDAYINLGDIFLRQKKFKEAKVIYSKAINLKPDSPLIFYKIGKAYLSSLDAKKAKSNFSKAIAIDPNFYKALGELGILNYQNGYKTKAFSQIKKILKLNISNETYLFRFGKEILSKHSFNDGIIIFKEVLNSKPNSILGHLFLGRCLYELGEFEQAIHSFKTALKLDCNNEIAINNLSFLLLNCNKYETIDEFISKKDVFRERVPIGYLTAQVIDQFSRYCLKDCQFTLDKIWEEMNKPFSQKLSKNDEHFSKTYFNFIGKLTHYHSNLGVNNERENSEKIYHLGDSHCLSFSNLSISFEKNKYVIKPLVITGLKAWHLANNQKNRFKRSVRDYINKIPPQSKIFISIGEIDCRIEEGIIRFFKKSNKTLFDIIQKTIKGFIDFTESHLRKNNIQAVYFGIPAPVISERNLNFWNSDQALLVEVVKTFNQILKDELQKVDTKFLDIYPMTCNKSGSSNNKYMIDKTHLHPIFLENIQKKIKILF